MLVDGAFTPTFDQVGDLVLAVVWLAFIAAAAVFGRIDSPQRA